jgi:ABC-type antimicrobial peptide transport system permease subunit
VTSQTLFAVTQENLPSYATLVALGFGRRSLLSAIFTQSLVLGIGGIILGALGFSLASQASLSTPIPLETTPTVFGGLMGISLLSCILSSFSSIRSLFKIDPVGVFRV